MYLLVEFDFERHILKDNISKKKSRIYKLVNIKNIFSYTTITSIWNSFYFFALSVFTDVRTAILIVGTHEWKINKINK